TVPKPLQTPHPPLFTTLTQSPETLDWAAKVGSTIVTLATEPAMARGMFEAYAAAAASYGRTVEVGKYDRGGGVALCRSLALGATHEQAWETARQGAVFTTDWLGEFGFFEAWRLPGQEGPVPRTVEQMVAAGALMVGTPDEVGEQIEKLRDETGVEYLVFTAAGGMTEHQRMLDMIQLFGEHVIPALSPTPSPADEAEFAVVD
nr:LLM class flavin-dependent oxidoreductase [Micromonospora sp. DSM 115978]